ncbi:P-loop containing nucleoside triphosphate hydrolase protein [Clohesyomyces aquaticus]|uniref:RNA helicase n=1 Tax=Clohesyomyces aquaticus TaxID=1231657 RepID=A0A1Y2A2J6_9PLEO|nr:P-loop containing nucleoside triphosphate hydrolase protein [Clohesyomyces aquaticus]
MGSKLSKWQDAQPSTTRRTVAKTEKEPECSDAAMPGTEKVPEGPLTNKIVEAAPAPIEPKPQNTLVETGFKAFSAMGLKPEILSGIEKLGLSEPSEIQQLAIPQLVQRKSLHIRHISKSGKSLALIISILQLIDAGNPSYQVAILVNTREQITQLLQYWNPVLSCIPDVRILGLYPNKLRDFFKTTGYQILLCTVGRFQYILQTGGLFDSWELHDMGVNLKDLRCLVFDDIEHVDMNTERAEELVGDILESLPADLQVVTASAIRVPELEKGLMKLGNPPALLLAGSPHYEKCMDQTMQVHVLAKEFRRDRLIKSKGYRFGADIDEV